MNSSACDPNLFYTNLIQYEIGLYNTFGEDKVGICVLISSRGNFDIKASFMLCSNTAQYVLIFARSIFSLVGRQMWAFQ